MHVWFVFKRFACGIISFFFLNCVCLRSENELQALNKLSTGNQTWCNSHKYARARIPDT